MEKLYIDKQFLRIIFQFQLNDALIKLTINLAPFSIKHQYKKKKKSKKRLFQQIPIQEK